jgi:transmembrane sensor
MRPGENDELWQALEGLRDRPLVAEARDYARRWARSRRRLDHARGVLVRSRGSVIFAAAVASIAGMVLFAWTPPDPARIIETAGIQTRTETLPDGSRVTLNANSRVSVAFTRRSRALTLLDGEAHFEVAKDVQRPFRVRAGRTEVVAVGTVFDVDKQADQTKVTLLEGRVDVRAVSDAGSDNVIVASLQPAQQLSLAQDGHVLSEKAVTSVDGVTAWQRGLISLDDMPLSEALAQVNRYSTVTVAMADSSLATRRVSGIFRVGDTKAFVSAVERYFGLKAIWKSDQSVVLERR